jgi:hypothetical protein
VTEPESVSRINPVEPGRGDKVVGMMLAATFAVNVNVKPFTETAHAGLIGPSTTEIVVGVKETD